MNYFKVLYPIQVMCKIFLILFNFFICAITFASNSTYITLSNQIAKKTQLKIVANNVANANTIGYESDSVLFKNIDTKQSSKRYNSFVYLDGSYKGESTGSLKTTNRDLDLAIAGDGYFKILTPRGDRYTLDGSVLINSDYVLVNSEGMPFASRDNVPIILPPEVEDIRVGQDGTIYADGDQVDVIGVFNFPDPSQLIKEGNSLYSSRINDILLDEVTVISGALRSSNVSSAKAMTDMVELQRSSSLTNNLMSEIGDLERSVITKIAK